MWLFKEFFEGTGLELWNFLRNFLGTSKEKNVDLFQEYLNSRLVKKNFLNTHRAITKDISMII